jgi:hypothetical protein
MPKDEYRDTWPRIGGLTRHWWSPWTDHNLYRASAKLEPFVDVLQAKFGYTREAAEEEFYRRKAQFEAVKSQFKKGAG